MKIYALCYRIGKKDNHEKDLIALTTSSRQHESWFKGPEGPKGPDPQFRRYSLTFTTQQFHCSGGGVYMHYSYRGGPGV